jgi:hypothetical protein
MRRLFWKFESRNGNNVIIKWTLTWIFYFNFKLQMVQAKVDISHITNLMDPISMYGNIGWHDIQIREIFDHSEWIKIKACGPNYNTNCC